MNLMEVKIRRLRTLQTVHSKSRLSLAQAGALSRIRVMIGGRSSNLQGIPNGAVDHQQLFVLRKFPCKEANLVDLIHIIISGTEVGKHNVLDMRVLQYTQEFRKYVV